MDSAGHRITAVNSYFVRCHPNYLQTSTNLAGLAPFIVITLVLKDVGTCEREGHPQYIADVLFYIRLTY